MAESTTIDTTIYDLAIMGAGPAGCMAAYTAAAEGARVALLEKAKLPRYKPCGGGLVGRGVAVLPPGLDLPVERQCHRVELSINSPSMQFHHDAAQPIVTMTMRADLDQALVEAAQAAGAELFTSRAVTGVERRNNGVRLETSSGPLHARFLVLASGALDRTAEQLGWPALQLSPALEWEIEVDDATLQRFAESARFDVGLLNQGYGWVFPKRHHLSVGLWSLQRGEQQLKQRLEAYLRGLDINVQHYRSKRGHQIPVVPRHGPAAQDRVLLTGDVLGLLDPVTAEGISHALLSGKLAGAAVVRGEGRPGSVEHFYERKLRPLIRDLRVGRLLARALYEMPRTRNFAMQRLGQSLASAISGLLAGHTTYKRMLLHPRNHLKAAQRLLAGPRVCE